VRLQLRKRINHQRAARVRPPSLSCQRMAQLHDLSDGEGLGREQPGATLGKRRGIPKGDPKGVSKGNLSPRDACCENCWRSAWASYPRPCSSALRVRKTLTRLEAAALQVAHLATPEELQI
jgi:hypothetical protein